MNIPHELTILLPIVGAFVAAFFGGLGVAAVYGPTLHKTKEEARPFATTLVLLAMLTAGAALMIGDSMARAFGLLGALSIVRFRTVVDDTRDTAFVVFAVVVGMACGSLDFRVAGAALTVVGAGALYLSRGNRPSPSAKNGVRFRVVVRTAVGRDPEALVGPVFTERVSTWTCVGAATSRQGAALEVRYDIRLTDPSKTAQLAQELNALDGVQHVEIEAV